MDQPQNDLCASSHVLICAVSSNPNSGIREVGRSLQDVRDCAAGMLPVEGRLVNHRNLVPELLWESTPKPSKVKDLQCTKCRRNGARMTLRNHDEASPNGCLGLLLLVIVGSCRVVSPSICIGTADLGSDKHISVIQVNGRFMSMIAFLSVIPPVIIFRWYDNPKRG